MSVAGTSATFEDAITTSGGTSEPDVTMQRRAATRETSDDFLDEQKLQFQARVFTPIDYQKCESEIELWPDSRDWQPFFPAVTGR